MKIPFFALKMKQVAIDMQMLFHQYMQVSQAMQVRSKKDKIEDPNAIDHKIVAIDHQIVARVLKNNS